MKDPTTAMRAMYVSGLNSICPVYDGMSPTDVPQNLYGVITATSFTRQPVKFVNNFRFVVTLEIYQEFHEYGNSEGVDTLAEQILELMIPMDSKSYLSIQGYSHDEVILTGGANSTILFDKGFNVYRKVLNITHSICEQ